MRVRPALPMAFACVLAVGCATDFAENEEVGTDESAVAALGCKDYDAKDHLESATWSHHAVYSSNVDLLDRGATYNTGDLFYNAYNYDYSGQCDRTFVTDVTARPSGNPKMTWRLTPSLTAGAGESVTLAGRFNAARCSNVYMEYHVYARKFGQGGSGTWYPIWNNYLNAEWINGKCLMPSVQATVDWKDGISGFGKVGALRFAATAGDADTLAHICLALDPDDQGDHLNALCPRHNL
jgi:hypothetical protein